MALAKGHEGEYEIIRILKDLGCVVRRPDLIFLPPNSKTWILVEVKNKEPFSPPPKFMQGIPQSQYDNDMRIWNFERLRTLLAVRGSQKEWLAQFMDELKPEPDPRSIAMNEDNLVWFGLEQFQPLFTIAAILPPPGFPLPWKEKT